MKIAKQNFQILEFFVLILISFCVCVVERCIYEYQMISL